MQSPPAFATFLSLPEAEIASLAPATVAFAPGGSRRQAAMLGIAPESQDYVTWAWAQMHGCLEVLFQHGVQHIITPLLTPTQLNEGGDYGQRVRDWVRWGFTGAEPLAYYQRTGWAVRLIGDLDQEFREIDDQLQQITSASASQTLWWTITRNYATPWETILASGAQSQTEAIRALYGTDIAPTSMLIATGKPLINTAIVPPVLLGDLQCYWIQRPGYVLDRQLLRQILYDYVYLRPTWREDKTGRAEAALAAREQWLQAPTLGLGQRVGPFWYPGFNEELGDEELGIRGQDFKSIGASPGI